MTRIRPITPMFKPVPGGYVFRAPSRWVFWGRRFYFVNEMQKAELVSIIAAPGPRRLRAHIFMVALFGLIFSATMILAYASGHSEPTGLDAAVLFGLLPLYLYGALVAKIWPLAHRIEPILAGLPPHPPVSLLDWGRPSQPRRRHRTSSRRLQN